MHAMLRRLLVLTLALGPVLSGYSQTHAYDAAGRLVRTTYADGKWAAYAYDAAGNLLRVTTSDTPVIAAGPATTAVAIGSPATLQAAATGPTLTYQWRRNGQPVSGATGPTLSISAVQPTDAGLYTVVVTNASGSIESGPAVLAPLAGQKVTGTADSLPDWQNIRHPNGNQYDQVLMTGPAVTVKADPGQVTRVSFIDLNDDIVQVEFSGAGSLSIVLEEATGPQPPAIYNQAVGYMKGRPTVVIGGADETSYVSVFSVGRANAVIPFNRLLELGYTMFQLVSSNITTGVMPGDKVPATMGGDGTETFLSRGQASGLFQSTATYDGVADLRALSLQSATGKFGGVFGGNMRYGGDRGPVGIHAPGIAVAVRVVLHDLRAEGDGWPILHLASSPAVLVAGGSLLQPNARPVSLASLTPLQMVAGSNSHGVSATAKACRARFEHNGVDVTTTFGVQGP